MRCDGEVRGEHGPALLKTVYEKRQIAVRTELPGIFQYIEWLPVDSYYLEIKNYEMGKPLCYKSEGLGKRLGLRDLYIAFSGFWPERGANLLTRTFKEFECPASLVRYLKNNLGEEPLPYIISSAGNTGNGYNLLAHHLGVPLFVVIPETGLDKLMLPFKTNPFVVVVKGDYSDAISMADQIAEKTGLVRDGGVRNVARRAGLGSVMLHAVTSEEEGTQQIFDHYFQAVGSGTGAIAAWEMVDLLRKDGRFGDGLTRIHIAQNAPFAPHVDAWEVESKELLKAPDKEAKERIFATTADVLSNRHPPYSIAGGVYDMLTATRGRAWRVTNYQVFHAARMFRENEGVDIGPAASVAVDALRQAVAAGEVKENDRVLLHITGGGKEIQYSKGPVFRVEPNLIVGAEEVDRVVEAIGEPQPITNHKDLLKKYKRSS
jgi:cysteate synthase